jgi:hypothetical protein
MEGVAAMDLQYVVVPAVAVVVEQKVDRVEMEEEEEEEALYGWLLKTSLSVLLLGHRTGLVAIVVMEEPEGREEVAHMVIALSLVIVVAGRVMTVPMDPTAS